MSNEENLYLNRLKDIIESCNINFLIGSGLSRPYLNTLGNIEKLLTEIESKTFESVENEKKEIIKASIYKEYFEGVIVKNLDENIQKDLSNYKLVLENYKTFLLILNEILLYRFNTLIYKKVNLFTTNIDLFLEKSLEETGLEFNDGFTGRYNPIFNLSNFQKSYIKTTQHYDNASEIPVFNLFKVHGSISWRLKNDQIFLSDLENIKNIAEELKKIKSDNFLKISTKSSTAELVEESKKIKLSLSEYKQFLDLYQNLQIVNPNKEKFHNTILNLNYYELLRIFANELEKENSVLFVLGFSYSDEHIREITIRVANSNPTLQVVIFAYDIESKATIEENLKIKSNSIKNNNIMILTKEIFYDEEEKKTKTTNDEFNYSNINDMVFLLIKNQVRTLKK